MVLGDVVTRENHENTLVCGDAFRIKFTIENENITYQIKEEKKPYNMIPFGSTILRKMKNIQVKIQGDISASMCHKKKLIIKNEEVSVFQSKAHQFVDHGKNKSFKIISTNNEELNKIDFVKNVLLVVDSPVEYITPELISEHLIEDLVKPSSSNHQDINSSESGEEYSRDDDCSDSDWEEEYFEAQANFKDKKISKNKAADKSNSIGISISEDFNTKSNSPFTKTIKGKAILPTENNSCRLQAMTKPKNQKDSSISKVFHESTSTVQTAVLNKNIECSLNEKHQATKTTTVVLSKPLGPYESKNNEEISDNLKMPVGPNYNENIMTSDKVEENSKIDSVLNFRKILPKPCASSYTFGIVEKTPSNIKRTVALDLPSGFTNMQNIPSVGSQYLYHCKECDILFKALEQFIYHKQAYLCLKKKEEASYQCDICGKTLANEENLKSHKNWHTNARPFKCFHCEKCFNNKKARHSHYKRKHSDQYSSARYMCTYCGYGNSKLKYLLAHEELHRLPTGAEIPKPFECKECGKHFRFDRNLKNHLKFHSSPSFFCGVCDKGFKSKKNLTQHMVTHSDYRPLTCHICGDRFKRMTHLKQHKSAIHGDGGCQ